MEFSQAVFDFKRRDLRGVDDFCWYTRSVGEGISFLGLSRLGRWDRVCYQLGEFCRCFVWS